jgi:type II secretory pathway pseudopilin PulG
MRTRRSAFTLLEIVLALGISVVLLSALYWALNTFVHHAQTGRDVVDQASHARFLLARIANDISGHLGPVNPEVFKKQASSQQGQPSAQPAEASSSSTQPEPESTSTSSAPTGYCNLGVQGEPGRLVLTVSRVPREVLQRNAEGAPAGVSDLRRITYWLSGGPDNILGLARQEITRVTADDEPIPPGIADEAAHVIADQVVGLTFEYWDGSAWVEIWDGSNPDNPTCPPVAIAINLTLARVEMRGGESVRGAETTYRQVVFIPTANGPPQSTETTSP